MGDMDIVETGDAPTVEEHKHDESFDYGFEAVNEEFKVS